MVLSHTTDHYNRMMQKQPNGLLEGGDSLNWTGHRAFMHWVGTGSVIDGLEQARLRSFASFDDHKMNGGFYRHPDPQLSNNGFAAYYHHPWDGVISRDQFTGLLLYIMTVEDWTVLKIVLQNHMFRFFLFAYNTRKNGKDPHATPWKIPDLTLFDIWALEIRCIIKCSLLGWILYPLLVLFDFQMLINSILVNTAREDEKDLVSYTGKLISSVVVAPTPFSWLSKMIASPKRLYKAAELYWCDWRKNCIMAEYTARALEVVGIR